VSSERRSPAKFEVSDAGDDAQADVIGGSPGRDGLAAPAASAPGRPILDAPPPARASALSGA